MIKRTFATINGLISLAVIFLVLGLDLFVKRLVLENSAHLPLYVISFFGKIDLWIDLVYNQGAAWGSFSDYHLPLFAVRVLIVGAVLYLFFTTSDEKKRLAFAFVIAGAFGNIYDTIVYQKVIDMIHFVFFGKSFGIFNLADASIFFGLILLMFSKKPIADSQYAP